MLRALDRAVRHSVPKPTALIVNFPSNPTAYLADLDFYREIVAFARRHEIWIMSDLAYAEIYFGDKPPPSLLQVPGAKEIAVEFTSLSKTYSMPGWRMGFAAGNRAADQRADADEVVSRLRRLHADPGCRGGRAERAAGLRGPDPRAVPRAPRRADPRPGVGRLGRAEPGGLDVRLGADPAAVFRAGQRRVLQAAAGAGQGGGVAGARVRRAWRGVSCASRWWRTPTGCARRCGISERSCRRGRIRRR